MRKTGLAAAAVLGIALWAVPAHAVPVTITYSITHPSGGIPGILGGAPATGGSATVVWSLTSLNGAFTGAVSIASVMLSNAYGTLTVGPTPAQSFFGITNLVGFPSIGPTFYAILNNTPVPPTITALNSSVSFFRVAYFPNGTLPYTFALDVRAPGTPYLYVLGGGGQEVARFIPEPSKATLLGVGLLGLGALAGGRSVVGRMRRGGRT